MATRRLSGGGRGRGGGSRGGSSPHASSAASSFQPQHHQWLAPLCGDPGRLRALVEELGAMVEKGLLGGLSSSGAAQQQQEQPTSAALSSEPPAAAAAVVTHVVSVVMEGEEAATGAAAAAAAAEEEPTAATAAAAAAATGHTAALSRALADRLGAAYLPAASAGLLLEDEEQGEGKGDGGVALLCCAWVHSGGRLEAAARGLLRRGYRCVRLALWCRVSNHPITSVTIISLLSISTQCRGRGGVALRGEWADRGPGGGTPGTD